MFNTTRKAAFAFVPAALALAALTPASFAQTAAPAPAHKPNFIQRHPTMTGIGAGLATHHALKVSARNAKMNHQKLNFAQRHPTLSAIGVGGVTRHEIKAHTAH